MSDATSLKQHSSQESDFLDVEAFLRRAERVLPERVLSDGRRILSIVALALIRRHPAHDGAGEEARLQRTMTALLGIDSVNGRPAKNHERALLRMADLHVGDTADREQWHFGRSLGLAKTKRRPRIRGAERLAEVAALEIYGEASDALIRRLKDDFNDGKPQLLALREQILATGEAEKELAALIIDILTARGVEADASVTTPAGLFEIEELVY